MCKRLFLVLVLLLMAQTAWAQETFTLAIPNGFLIGEDYLKMNDQEKNKYVIGFINGLTVAPLMGADPEIFAQVEVNVLREGITNLEYMERLTSYIEGIPGNRTRGLNILTFEAFMKTYVPNI